MSQDELLQRIESKLKVKVNYFSIQKDAIQLLVSKAEETTVSFIR